MNFKSLSQWLMVKAAAFTIVFAPVSQGLAAQKIKDQIDKAQLQEALSTMGLNKSTTYGEFYKKNKSLFPERLQKELEPYFTKFSNEPMPQFEVSQAKDSAGNMIPVLRLSQSGQLHNIQFFGQDDKFVKFNNTQLSTEDVINFDDMLIRLSAGDAKLRQQLEVKNSVSAPFKGYPAISASVWQSMKPADKASYILNMRDLWNDARKVLSEKDKLKNSKRKFSLYNAVFSNEAYAQFEDTTQENIAPAASIAPKTPAVQSQANVATTPSAIAGTTCIVAGYVSRYTNKGVCSVDKIIRDQRNGGFIDEANHGSSDVGESKKHPSACDNNAGFYACNPLIYGAPGGKAICINKRSVEFQKATHWQADKNESCDQKSRLTSQPINLDGNSKTAEFYSGAAAKAEQAALSEQMNEDFKRSKDFIDGLLLFKGKKALGSDPLDQDTFNIIKTLRDNFNEDIQKARESCSAQMSYKKHEKNFYGACEQLHKRFLFVSKVLEKSPGCSDGAKLDENSLMCICPDGKNKLPGEKCEQKPVDPQPPVVTPVDPPTVVGKCDPMCDSNKEKCAKVTEHNGVEVWQCVSIADGKPVIKKEKGRFWKFMGKALPWIAGAGVLAAMYFLWKPKIPKLKAAGDLCPNGQPAPCVQSCTAPKVYSNGVCVCPACPPGQTVTDLNACTCSTSGTNGPTKYTCADGVTVVTDLKDCPKPKYTCWDGTIVENPMNCPEKPANDVNINFKTGK